MGKLNKTGVSLEKEPVSYSWYTHKAAVPHKKKRKGKRYKLVVNDVILFMRLTKQERKTMARLDSKLRKAGGFCSLERAPKKP